MELDALRDFLALEAPVLGPHAERILAAKGLPPDLIPDGDPRPLWPGTTTADAAGWARAALGELIEGFFRRRELRASLTRDERLEMHRVMVLSRRLDDVLKRLHQEKKIAWGEHPSAQKGFRATGQEASAALALRLRRGREHGDVVSPLIRGLPLWLMCTDDAAHPLLAQIGKAGTPMEGRDLHIGDLARGVLPPAAPLAIGVQTLVGLAWAAALRKEDRVFLSVMGEGGTSLGEWHESVNLAAVRKLPVVFVVENNRWALGTHWREQTAAPRFALKAAGYGIPGATVFGNDPDEVAAAAAWAVERARAGKGPTLLELQTYRRAGHAHHDDDRYHATVELADERMAWEAADPIVLYEARLRAEGLLGDPRPVHAEAERRIAEAERWAVDAPWPTVPGEVYAPRVDAVPAEPAAETREMSYDEAVRDALTIAMEKDPRVVVLGEDVGGRYGGAFGVTRGLAKRFGPDRCWNTPLAESAILGAATGAALAGLRPVVEMQFADFVACGFNALVNNAAKVRWRWGRAVPMVVRLPYGSIPGGGPFHSQCPEAWFLRVPGLKIVAPATPLDAKRLLLAAIRDNNPVVYLEAKGLYSMHSPWRQAVPTGDVEAMIGRAAVVREGRDVSIFAYGPGVAHAMAAADAFPAGTVEVVDLRSLAPLDEEAILRSVAKTHRAVIVHEDAKTGGVGAEIAARIAEKAVWELEGPVTRVASPDTPVPYAPPLEASYLAKDVAQAVRDLLR